MQLGYTRPDLVATMTETASRLPHARPATFDSVEGEAYREALQRAAGPPFTRVLLTSSGSEAVEVAIKAAWWFQRARGAPHRKEILSLAGHYHGATLGALDATGYTARRAPFGGLLGERAFGPAAHCARCFRGLSYPGCALACADAALERAEEAAAFLAETVPAAGLAAAVPPLGWTARVRERCDAAGALWIADEVLTGFGRAGALFAWSRLAERDGTKAVPDLVVFGKGAGAGFFPLAGVLVSERVAAALDDGDGGFRHTQSFGGNPVACAVGLKALAAFEEERIFERVRRSEAEARGALAPLSENPAVFDIRGIGLLWGVELAAPSEGRPPFARERRVAEEVAEGCRARGVLVHAAAGFAAGGAGDAILIAPPLIVEPEALKTIAAALAETLDVLAPGGPRRSWVEDWEDR
jgi:adenosylmethionine-8-amino-7-oxononanoate aminotransferase